MTLGGVRELRRLGRPHECAKARARVRERMRARARRGREVVGVLGFWGRALRFWGTSKGVRVGFIVMC